MCDNEKPLSFTKLIYLDFRLLLIQIFSLKLEMKISGLTGLWRVTFWADEVLTEGPIVILHFSFCLASSLACCPTTRTSQNSCRVGTLTYSRSVSAAGSWPLLSLCSCYPSPEDDEDDCLKSYQNSTSPKGYLPIFHSCSGKASEVSIAPLNAS